MVFAFILLYCHTSKTSVILQLLGQAARNMVIQEDAILHSEDVRPFIYLFFNFGKIFNLYGTINTFRYKYIQITFSSCSLSLVAQEVFFEEMFFSRV